MEARSAVTISASAEDVYARWRDFEQLPSFMYHLESVKRIDDRRSHWVANGPADTTIEWDAEITEDVPGERIGWRSSRGAMVPNEGVVRFTPAPGDRGTEVHVEISYEMPLGGLGATVAKLFGEEPDVQVSDDLRRFKQLIETGEIARSDAAPWGVRTQNIGHQRDAHPQEVQA